MPVRAAAPSHADLPPHSVARSTGSSVPEVL